MAEGWKCPNCGKAHGPHVATCPEPASAVPVIPWRGIPTYPPIFMDPPPSTIPGWPYVTCTLTGDSQMWARGDEGNPRR